MRIKPKHRAELRYLMGDVHHLQRLCAPEREIAAAMKRLAARHLELYPELLGMRVAMSDDMKSMDVFDNPEEWAAAMVKSVEVTKKAPYVAFASDEACTDYDVMGPTK